MKDKYIEVNGFRFHFMWLRDNCICEKCRHKTSFQKLYDYTEQSSVVYPLSVVKNEENIKVVWQDNHESIFPVNWLMEYTKEDEKEKITLWDIEKIKQINPSKVDYGKSVEFYFEQLVDLGFIIIKNIPKEKLNDFVLSFGPIHATEYGDFASVKSTHGANDLAETGYGLTVHTDYSTYMHIPPLVQFLYCVKNDAKGGESIIVDGFKVIEDLKRTNPEDYDILVNTDIEFQQIYTKWKYYFRRRRPIIELDKEGQTSGVFFGHSHCYNWQMPLKKIEPFYAAYKTLFEKLKSSKYQYKFLLNPGDCLLVNNNRVLHGRESFDIMHGERHLEVSYVNWDFIMARKRFNKQSLNQI